MTAQPAGQEWQAEDLHALAELLADLTPGATPVDHLDQLEALERITSAVAAARVVVAAAFADAGDTEAGADDGGVPVRGRRRPPRAM